MALTLLEVIRSQDRPTEVLKDEDPSVTMPRRLGLSDVIIHQIARYREDVKRKRRNTEAEVSDLFRLVTRRPDAPEVFFEVGLRLSTVPENPKKSLNRFFPKRFALGVARRKVRRRLNKLFGRLEGGFAPGTFVYEARTHLFIRGDPGGFACQLVSGLCERTIAPYVKEPHLVVHVSCQGRGEAACRWVAVPKMDRSLGFDQVRG